jgi:hypothetical protein
MPARPPVAGVCKVELEGTVGSHNWACVFHVQYSGGPPSGTDLDTFAAIIGANWVSAMTAQSPATVVLGTVTVTDLASSMGAQGVALVNTPGSNGSSGTIAGNAAVLINYPSSFRYRGGHPRTYLPPPPDDFLLNPSQLTTGAVGNINAAFATLQSSFFGTTVSTTTFTNQCAVSYVTAGSPRVTPVVMPIGSGSYTVVQQLASQRRRIGRK